MGLAYRLSLSNGYTNVAKGKFKIHRRADINRAEIDSYSVPLLGPKDA